MLKTATLRRTLMTLALCGVGLTAPAAAAPSCDPGNGGLTLPPGFCAQVVAENLGVARHLAVAANGNVYVALRGIGDTRAGVIALRDADGDGKFEQQEHFGDGSLTGIRIHDGFLYVASENDIRRYRLTPGRLTPASAPEMIVSGLPGGRQHGSKGMAFDEAGAMYVNIGAPSNTCQVKAGVPESPGQDPCQLLEKHGGIWKFDAAKSGQTQESGSRFATGLRQMLALAWHNKTLYTAMNSRDGLDTQWPGRFTADENADRPAEPLYQVTQGANFGWPYCFYDYAQKKLLLNPEYGGDGRTVGRCSLFTPPIAAYPGHWAPVDLMFYNGKQFPSRFRGGAFIVFHGSWNRSPGVQKGYNVVFQPFNGGKPSGQFEVFADGFAGKTPLLEPTAAVARPDGVAEAPDGSIYVTDSQKGTVWRILYTGK